MSKRKIPRNRKVSGVFLLCKKFKIKPDETLAVIQELYEKKLVTYPRTDARVLSTAVAKEITKNLNGIAKGFKDEEVQKYINKMKEEKYSTNLVKTKYVNDSKITDHYAIIPTGQGFENYDALPDLQKQMYKVIVKRFLSIFYPPAEYSKISVTIEVENEQFSASGRMCEKLGYLEVAKNEPKKENAEEQPEEQNSLEILRSLKKGEEIGSSVQANLVMLFNLDNLEKHERDITMHVFNYLFGSGGLTSKLYRSIREKYSLCYNINSLYLKYDKLLLVHTSLENENVLKAINLAKKDFKSMQHGEFTTEELNDAISNMLVSIDMSSDNNISIINNYVFKVYDNLPDLDERKKLFKEVTKSDVINVAKKIKLNTIFVLKGKGE